MTVNELIRELKEIGDPEAEVHFSFPTDRDSGDRLLKFIVQVAPQINRIAHQRVKMDKEVGMHVIVEGDVEGSERVIVLD